MKLLLALTFSFVLSVLFSNAQNIVRGAEVTPTKRSLLDANLRGFLLPLTSCLFKVRNLT